MTDNLNPIDDLAGVFVTEASKVAPPAEYRGELGAPVAAVHQALDVADHLEAALADVVNGVRDGRYSKDQAERLQRNITGEAERKANSLLTNGKTTVDLLPRKIAGQVFPDAPPDGIGDRWNAVQARFDGLADDPAALTTEFVTMVRDAVADGDRKTAGALMSTRGRDELRKRLGRKQADELWPTLRSAAMDEAAGVGQGSDGAGLTARKMVPQVQRAFTTGLHLVDMKMKEAQRRTDEALRQMW